MKKSLLIVFLLLTMIPLCVITWMSFSSYSRQRENTEERYSILARKQLEEIDRLMLSHLRNVDERLREFVAEPEIDAMRKIARTESLVRQMFSIDSDRTYVYPPEDGEISARERSFLEQARELELSSILTPRRPESGRDGISEYGWYTWFMGDGINFIFWHSEPDGKLSGIEVERTALISSFIAILPESDPTVSEEQGSRVSLTDARGRKLYQWGLFSPPEGAMPIAELPLSPPLGAWRLRLYMDTDSGDGAFRTPGYLTALAGVIALIIVMAFLALYFYRENAKIVRDALQKVSFVNQVSHELKTPLTNIRLYAELLDTRLEAAKDRSDIGVIVAESTRLGRMINNVLTFARADRNGFGTNPEDGVIDEIITRVVDAFAPALAEHGIEVELVCNAKAVVSTDIGFVEQILGNLIGNVEKYAREGGFLRIASDQDATWTQVTVRDRGPGIPSREQRNVFKPFYRISNKLTDGVSGAGIGLAISRMLAEKMGGRLVLQKVDTGAAFKLEIPNRGGGGPK
jgi:signal transduction histidine kinase